MYRWIRHIEEHVGFLRLALNSYYNIEETVQLHKEVCTVSSILHMCLVAMMPAAPFLHNEKHRYCSAHMTEIFLE